MPAGNESLICGGYTLSWHSNPLGMFEGDSGLPQLEHSTAAEEIGNTSVYGRSVIDGIYLGANWFATMTCLEYITGTKDAFWPYATMGRMGTIGVLQFSISQALVMTAISGTSASSTPATLTATNTLLANGFTTRLFYGPTLRKVPLRFRLFPYTSTQVKWFSET